MIKKTTGLSFHTACQIWLEKHPIEYTLLHFEYLGLHDAGVYVWCNFYDSPHLEPLVCMTLWWFKFWYMVRLWWFVVIWIILVCMTSCCGSDARFAVCMQIACLLWMLNRTFLLFFYSHCLEVSTSVYMLYWFSLACQSECLYQMLMPNICWCPTSDTCIHWHMDAMFTQGDLYIHILRWEYLQHRDLQYSPFMVVPLHSVPREYLEKIHSASLLRCAGPVCRYRHVVRAHVFAYL